MDKKINTHTKNIHKKRGDITKVKGGTQYTREENKMHSNSRTENKTYEKSRPFYDKDSKDTRQHISKISGTYGNKIAAIRKRSATSGGEKKASKEERGNAGVFVKRENRENDRAGDTYRGVKSDRDREKGGEKSREQRMYAPSRALISKPPSTKYGSDTYKHKRLQKQHETSWGNVATWYDAHLEDTNTYHEQVILPRLTRIVGDTSSLSVLDLACGQGYFATSFVAEGKEVIGVDISKELITIAEKNQKEKIKNNTSSKKVSYYSSPSHDLYMVKDKSIDVVICVLALQNIEMIQETCKEVKRVLKDKGRFIFVLNHPSFRVLKHSGWGYDEELNMQYRKVDEYLSEAKVKIDMNPGSKNNKEYTISFHRPLQFWSKVLCKYGFSMARVEEWESHRESEEGPRKEAENKARKEIPLFLCVEAIQC